MEHTSADWENADQAHLGTYRRFMKLTAYSTVFLIILLILMALFLV